MSASPQDKSPSSRFVRFATAAAVGAAMFAPSSADAAGHVRQVCDMSTLVKAGKLETKDALRLDQPVHEMQLIKGVGGACLSKNHKAIMFFPVDGDIKSSSVALDALQMNVSGNLNGKPIISGDKVIGTYSRPKNVRADHIVKKAFEISEYNGMVTVKEHAKYFSGRTGDYNIVLQVNGKNYDFISANTKSKSIVQGILNNKDAHEKLAQILKDVNERREAVWKNVDQKVNPAVAAVSNNGERVTATIPFGSFAATQNILSVLNNTAPANDAAQQPVAVATSPTQTAAAEASSVASVAAAPAPTVASVVTPPVVAPADKGDLKQPLTIDSVRTTVGATVISSAADKADLAPLTVGSVLAAVGVAAANPPVVPAGEPPLPATPSAPETPAAPPPVVPVSVASVVPATAQTEQTQAAKKIIGEHIRVSEHDRVFYLHNKARNQVRVRYVHELANGQVWTGIVPYSYHDGVVTPIGDVAPHILREIESRLGGVFAKNLARLAKAAAASSTEKAAPLPEARSPAIQKQLENKKHTPPHSLKTNLSETTAPVVKAKPAQKPEKLAESAPVKSPAVAPKEKAKKVPLPPKRPAIKTPKKPVVLKSAEVKPATPPAAPVGPHITIVNTRASKEVPKEAFVSPRANEKFVTPGDPSAGVNMVTSSPNLPADKFLAQKPEQQSERQPPAAAPKEQDAAAPWPEGQASNVSGAAALQELADWINQGVKVFPSVDAGTFRPDAVNISERLADKFAAGSAPKWDTKKPVRFALLSKERAWGKFSGPGVPEWDTLLPSSPTARDNTQLGAGNVATSSGDTAQKTSVVTGGVDNIHASFGVNGSNAQSFADSAAATIRDSWLRTSSRLTNIADNVRFDVAASYEGLKNDMRSVTGAVVHALDKPLSVAEGFVKSWGANNKSASAPAGHWWEKNYATMLPALGVGMAGATAVVETVTLSALLTAAAYGVLLIGVSYSAAGMRLAGIKVAAAKTKGTNWMKAKLLNFIQALREVTERSDSVGRDVSSAAANATLPAANTNDAEAPVAVAVASPAAVAVVANDEPKNVAVTSVPTVRQAHDPSDAVFDRILRGSANKQDNTKRHRQRQRGMQRAAALATAKI